MSNIDKREIHNQQLKAFITGFLSDPAHDNQSSRSLTAEVFRIALASLEAEPVAYIRDGFRTDGVHFCGGIITAEEHERTKPALSDRYNWKHQPLYTAPPALVSVPDEATPENIEILASTFAPRGVTYQWDKDECNAAADSWNACRAAMLQGADRN